jgi:hypothetical protein
MKRSSCHGNDGYAIPTVNAEEKDILVNPPPEDTFSIAAIRSFMT